MKIEQKLQELGLNEKEAKIYLACLQLGPNTAYNIAERSRLKRSTTYFTLNLLMKQGLVSLKQTKKVTLYSAANPKRLLTQLRHKGRVLDDLLPTLSAVYNYDHDKPNIQVFEGWEGLNLVYLEIMEFLKKGKEVCFYGDISHAPQFQSLVDSWLNETKNRRYKIREIFNQKEKNKDYFNKVRQNKNPNHRIRFLPKKLSLMENDNAVFDNKLAIFSIKSSQFVTVIESQAIANSYRVMFELAWRQAEKINRGK